VVQQVLGCIIAAIVLSATGKAATMINIRDTALQLQATRSSLSSPLCHVTAEETREAIFLGANPGGRNPLRWLFCLRHTPLAMSAGSRGGFAWMLALTSAGGTSINLRISSSAEYFQTCSTTLHIPDVP
jgi:hypothetical protein